MEHGQDFGWEYSAEAWIRGQGEEGDRSRREILDQAVEKLLPDIRGWTVLDVGCGEGRYCRVLRSRGAHPVGLDPTESLLRRARERDPEGQYDLGVGEALPYSDDRFDLVLSYLSLIDIEDYEAASREMVRVCRPGAEILLVMLSNLASVTETWVKDDQGNRLYRTVDRYMESFHLDVEWSGIRIRNYHRPLSKVMQAFLNCGCVLTWFDEPLPLPESDLFADEFRVPTFQILKFRKND
jgi:SAM-dependent methyltransferase